MKSICRQVSYAGVTGKDRAVRVDPLSGPIGPILTFPDRDLDLERVNQPLGSFKAGDPVGCTDGDGDTRVPQFDRANAMYNRAFLDGPLGECLISNLFHFFQGHFSITLIVKSQCFLLACEFSSRSNKQDTGSGVDGIDRFKDSLGVDRVGGDLNHRVCLPSADRGNERNFSVFC